LRHFLIGLFEENGITGSIQLATHRKPIRVGYACAVEKVARASWHCADDSSDFGIDVFSSIKWLYADRVQLEQLLAAEKKGRVVKRSESVCSWRLVFLQPISREESWLGFKV
jgi:hypothetical protein